MKKICITFEVTDPVGLIKKEKGFIFSGIASLFLGKQKLKEKIEERAILEIRNTVKEKIEEKLESDNLQNMVKVDVV